MSRGTEYEGKFWVLPGHTWHIILGYPELKTLSIRLSFEGIEIFKGADTFYPVSQSPTLLVDQCIHFQAGSPEERQKITNLLIMHKDHIFECSGRYGWGHGLHGTGQHCGKLEDGWGSGCLGQEEGQHGWEDGWRTCRTARGGQS